MTFYAEYEVESTFPFDLREIGEKVAKAVLESERCPFEAQVQFELTNNDGICQINREFREIDRPTDVLSFPNLEFDTPGDFSFLTGEEPDCFDFESGELVLGDIVVSSDKVYSQAEEFGHSTLREFAFLIAHSMLHLCGYDHMEPEEAKIMEAKQEAILQALGITRDMEGKSI